MKPLKIFVGIDGKFVLCEKFPRDEEHEGLHEMLEFFMENDAEIENPTMGFKTITFSINKQEDYNPMIDMYDAYLEIECLDDCIEDQDILLRENNILSRGIAHIDTYVEYKLIDRIEQVVNRVKKEIEELHNETHRRRS